MSPGPFCITLLKLGVREQAQENADILCVASAVGINSPSSPIQNIMFSVLNDETVAG